MPTDKRCRLAACSSLTVWRGKCEEVVVASGLSGKKSRTDPLYHLSHGQSDRAAWIRTGNVSLM